ncbi:MAG: hypothetical protein ACP5RP_02210 [Candidatus Micrarchaeia archaeon]
MIEMVKVDLLGILSKDTLSEEFGKSRYYKAIKPRPHISKSALDKYDSSRYMDNEDAYSVCYSQYGKRYISTVNLSYDFALSLYEINSSSLEVIRAYKMFKAPEMVLSAIRKLKKNWRYKIEARIIGLQNNEQNNLFDDILEILDKESINLVEADIFGNELRHIAFDSKLGISYDVLLNDVLYKPGSLINTLTEDQFMRGKA